MPTLNGEERGMAKATLRRPLGWIVGGMLALSGCATNPATGESEISLMSPEQELTIGKEADQQIVSQYGLYEDPKLGAYVNQIGQKIAKQSELPGLTWHFKVLDSPVVNAFALPAGYVYVTRGLLAHVQNEAQLAVVLGHEIGHVTARHTARRFTRQQLTSLFVGLGALFIQEMRPFLDAIDLGLQLLFLRYSRDDERMADRLGVKYALKSGYQASDGSEFFRTLDRTQELSKGNHLPAWASTHPEPGEREGHIVRYTHELLPQLPAVPRDGTNPADFLPKLDNLVYGDNPRQGFVKGHWFYHPDLAFQLPVPANWQVQNLPFQVVMTPRSRDAQMILRMAPAKSPQAAAQEFFQANRLQVVERQAVTIHGMPAFRAISRASMQGQEGSTSVRILSTFVQKGDRMFILHGIAPSRTFSAYGPLFLEVSSGFSPVTDPAILKLQPHRIVILVAPKTAPLGQLLAPLPEGVNPRAVAIMNQRELEEQVFAGTLIKDVR